MKNKKSPQNDNSPFILQRPKIKSNLNIRERQLTEKQKQFLQLAFDKEVKLIFVLGPAGTTKTFLAVYAALKLLNERRVSDLIYVRSVVESSDQKMGYLPGEKEDKLQPYIEPLLDKLEEFLPKNEIDMLKKEERITGMGVSFLRGLNWNAKVVIGDEFQNCTYKEIVTFITRIGEFSKVFVLGDPDQADINGKSGLQKMVTQFDDDESKKNGIHVFKFDSNDVLRSGLVRFIVDKLNRRF